MKKMKVSAENKAEIRDCIKAIPKSVYDYYNGSPYELMAYIHTSDGDCDLDDFYDFKGISDLEKAIERVIKNYGHQLSHIDFKWSEEEDEFDQFTIYSV